MEPDGSLPQSQVPDNCPYPEPARSSPHAHIPLPEDPSYYYSPPIYAWVSEVVSFSQVSPPKPCIHLSSPPIRATCPAHLILLKFTSRTSRRYVTHAFHVRVGVLESYYMHACAFTHFVHVFYFTSVSWSSARKFTYPLKHYTRLLLGSSYFESVSCVFFYRHAS